MKHKLAHKGLVVSIVMMMMLSLVPVSWADDGACDGVLLQDWFCVRFEGATDNGDGTWTWTYYVEELDVEKAKDLSHWVIGIPTDAVVVGGDPMPYEVGTDPKTGVYGVKWEVGDSFTSGTFSFTLEGSWAQGSVEAASKAGPKTDVDWVPGPGYPPSDVPDGYDGDPGEGDGGDEGGSGEDDTYDGDTWIDPCYYEESAEFCDPPPEGEESFGGEVG